MPNKALTIIAGIVALAAMTTAAQADDTAARCKSLAAQWDTAKVAKATNANFGKAKVWAKTAAHDCTRDEAQHRSDGIDEYIKALQLVGVTPY